MPGTAFHSNFVTQRRVRLGLAVSLAVVPVFCCVSLYAQTTDAGPSGAVESELRGDKADTSLWKYWDKSSGGGKSIVADAVQTPQGELRRTVAVNGQPLTREAAEKETERIRRFVGDTEAQAKARKSGAHDDAQATAFLKMLPQAFVWTVDSQKEDAITLHYQPNPAFQPPTLESRVLAVMAGEMVVALPGYRIESLSGHLTRDVLFGYGILGRMNKGGTFRVERREVAPGHWEITQSNVHIGGHALLFKSIGQDSDEVKTQWVPSTAPTLAAAAKELGVE